MQGLSNEIRNFAQMTAVCANYKTIRQLNGWYGQTRFRWMCMLSNSRNFEGKQLSPGHYSWGSKRQNKSVKLSLEFTHTHNIYFN